MRVADSAASTPISETSDRPRRRWIPVRSRSLLVACARAIDVVGAVGVVAWINAAHGAIPAAMAVLAIVMLLFAWMACGVYERSMSLDAVRLRFRFLAGAGAAIGFFLSVAYVLNLPAASVGPALWGGGATIAVAAIGRGVLAAVAGRWRADGEFSRMIVVVGTTPAAARYIEKVRRDGDRVVGVFGPDAEAIGTVFAGCPVIGSFADIPRHPALAHVDRVAVANFALSEDEETKAADILSRLRSFPYEVDLAVGLSGAADDVRAFPVLVRPMSGVGALAKTLFDRILAGLLLILLLPVLCALAIAIRLDTAGPALFRQPRPGMGDATIGVFKFRTMHGIDPTGRVETAESDPRVTRVGGFLRRYRLDELPQLINVVIGEMSLVGPRPLPSQAQLDHGVMGDILREHARRRAVKPGITGWAQVNGHEGPCRTAESLQRRIEFDLYYINHWSLWLDFRILWRTIGVVFGGRGGVR